MNVRDFLELCSDWNGNLTVNDNRLRRIAQGRTVSVVDKRPDIMQREFVSFCYINDELCIRTRKAKHERNY